MSFSITLSRNIFLFTRTWWLQVIAWPSFTSHETITPAHGKHWQLETVSSSDLCAPAMFSYTEITTWTPTTPRDLKKTPKNQNAIFHAKHERRWWPPAGKATRRTQSQHVCCNNESFTLEKTRGEKEGRRGIFWLWRVEFTLRRRVCQTDRHTAVFKSFCQTEAKMQHF